MRTFPISLQKRSQATNRLVRHAHVKGAANTDTTVRGVQRLSQKGADAPTNVFQIEQEGVVPEQGRVFPELYMCH